MAQEGKGAENERGAVYRWKFAEAEFDEAAWELRLRGEPVAIEQRPLDVLACLLRHAGEVVTKDELFEAAWPGRIVVEGALTNAIGKLRKALDDEAQALIVTVPRVGYRLVGKVERRAVERRTLATHLRAGDAIARRPHWRLTRCLDDGDRGEVWLAEHDKTRSVRVFKFSFDGSRLASLKREVTISRLLHDSLGERGDFVYIDDWDFDAAPYFIESEFGGPNLEEWCEARGGLATVPLEARLNWLAEVADALAAAHDVGVLHKDLKPANLLVRGEAGDFHPRLVDFGSGKLLEPERLEALGITRLGITQTQNADAYSITGTLLYLAPELLAGQLPTVRSDIYALGVMLFQLCVGDLRRPLSAGWESEIGDDLLREDIAAAANGNPALRMDSARAFAKRLRTREERRVKHDAAAAAQAELARRDQALARIRARRPWVVTAYAILMIGLASTVWMYQRASQASAHADNEAQIAKAVNRFLNDDVLGEANPMRGGHADITVREAMDKAAPNIDRRFYGFPDVAAQVHMTAGHAYIQLSDLDVATAQFHAAAAKFDEANGLGSTDATGARVLEAQSLARSTHFDAASALLEQTRADVAKYAPEHPRLRIDADLARSWLEFNSLHFDKAVTPLEDAALALVAIPDADPAMVDTVQQALISARSRMGFPPENLEDTQQRLLAKIQSDQGRSAPMALGARHLLARIQVLRGKGREMEQTYLDLARDFTRVMGPENENTLLVMHGLANIYTKLERWPDCERSARIAYEGLNRRTGPNHIDTLNALDTLALAEYKLGHIDEASKLFESGIDRLQKSQSKLGGLLLAAFEINLAYVRLAQDRLQDTAAAIASARAHGGALLQKDSDAQGELACLQGRVDLRMGDAAKAAQLIKQGVVLLEKQNPSSYWVIRDAQTELQNAGSLPRAAPTPEAKTVPTATSVPR